MRKKIFPPSLSTMHRMLTFVQDYCLEEEIEYECMFRIILSLEEAVVNIILHGNMGSEGFIEIHCGKTQDQSAIKIMIKDQGIPFNPLKKIETLSFDESMPLTEIYLFPGGLGISLYVEMMDVVEYQRTKEGNQLTFIKFF